MLQDAGSHVELFATPGPQTAGELAVQSGRSRLRSDPRRRRRRHHQRGGQRNRRLQRPFRHPARRDGQRSGQRNRFLQPARSRRATTSRMPCPFALRWVLLERPDQPRRYFVLMAGVGLDARIVYELDLDLKGRLGKLAYWHGGFRQLGRPVPRFHLSVNGSRVLRQFRADHARTKLWRRFRDCAPHPPHRQRFRNRRFPERPVAGLSAFLRRRHDKPSAQHQWRCDRPRHASGSSMRRKISAFIYRPTARRLAFCPPPSRRFPTPSHC